jgi:endonuclease/exonuclease/phosphatase family metal-dependent hydrolase
MVVPPAQKLRIASWNLLHGEQIPPAANLSAQQWKENLITATQVIKEKLKPDFLGLQEVDYMQPRSGNLNQTKVIAETLGFKYWSFLPAITGTPGESWQKVVDLDQALINQSSDSILVRSDNSTAPAPSYGIGFVTNQPVKKIYVKQLGRSLIGMPLAIPKVQPGSAEKPNGFKLIYIKDEPRVAITAELESGLTITNTHLSFAPGVNVFQLNKLAKHLQNLPGLQLLIGDMNLPGNLPQKLATVGGNWISLVTQNTYPSWKPGIQFDYLLSRKEDLAKFESVALPSISNLQLSDHIPIGAEISFN